MATQEARRRTESAGSRAGDSRTNARHKRVSVTAFGRSFARPPTPPASCQTSYCIRGLTVNCESFFENPVTTRVFTLNFFHNAKKCCESFIQIKAKQVPKHIKSRPTGRKDTEVKEKESKTGNTRSRFFALVTYRTNTEGLVQTLENRMNSIRAYALIKHDRDETDPHHHMVLRTHCAWTCPQVVKWFVDESGQNTFAQIVHDRQGIIDYLTHEGDHAEGGKAHYDKSEIIDGGLCDILPAGDASDDSWEIIQAMLEGRSTRELCRMYGRDFIYHYSSYASIANVIRQEEGLE